jgi:hypothetical protein
MKGFNTEHICGLIWIFNVCSVNDVSAWDLLYDDDNRAAPGVPNPGRSHPGYGNHHDNGEGEKDPQGGEKGIGKGKRTHDNKAKGKGKWTGNSKGKGSVKQTPGGDDISGAVALLLQKDISEADLDMEG